MFASKPQLAGALLDRAHCLGSAPPSLAGDEVYGGRQLRRGIRQRGMGYVMAVRANHTARTEDRRRVLRLLVKDVLIGPEKITIRHRIPVREPATSGGGHHDTTDTEGDMRASYELCWGVVSPVLANLFLHYAFDMFLERGIPDGGIRTLRR